MPALIAAVIKACGDQQGLIPDPRACKFDLSTVTCKSGDDDSCLTPAQSDVVRKLWDGPVDEKGDRLSAGDMPIGSEAAWTGTMVPKAAGQTLDTVGDYQWSYDFPNYMARLGEPTGVTNQNMQFDKESFDRLQAYSGLYDPTNPDLSAFAKHGGKLIIWQGWSDSGVSPYISLNYVHAVRAAMGADEAGKFLVLYMLPGVYHCNLYGGPTTSREDFLTPMMTWVEDGRAPDRIVVEYSGSKDGTISAKSRPAYPYPAEVAYSGSGDVNNAASYVRAEPQQRFDDQLSWLGLHHYSPGHLLWCEERNAAVTCAPR
jgi:feruloyl esterase